MDLGADGFQTFRHVAGWYYAAPYGVYPTQDGHMALSLSPLGALAEAIGEPRLANYADKDPWTKQDEISELIAQRLETAPMSEWAKRMELLGIWYAPVQDYAQIVADPQVKHMKSLVTVAGTGKTAAPVTLVNHPVLYDGETAGVRLPPTCAFTRSSRNLPRSSCRSLASTRPKMSSSGATRPVHPVWWLAPSPAPLSPWKYS